jgi:two-component system, cell cycle response regulator
VRILIAEDDFNNRCVLVALLKKAGHEPVETVNGAEALQVLQQPEAPRLAILDWVMPQMNGLEVLQRIRAHPTDLPPYILMLTNKRDTTEIIAGLDAGANDYLTKPFKAGELRARVEVGRRMVEMHDELVKSRDALAQQVNSDPLTGMLNRRAILDLLHKELSHAGRHGDMLSVGICDIDHFKTINDTYGHQTGDDVLCELARIMSACCREYDSVGRIGGEEFLIIAPMKDGTMECDSLFNRLCATVAGSTLATRSGSLSVTVSIGVTIATGSSAVGDILSAADSAMYNAKAGGRNRVELVHKGT